MRNKKEGMNTNGNIALFCDLVGTLVAMDATRRLPLDASGKIKIELLPRVKEILAPMRDRLIFVVTNQADIKRGRLTLPQVETALHELDVALGGILTAWQICPHDSEDGCECRKPRAGMIMELAAIHGVNLKASAMVGDQASDAEAARNAELGRFVYARDFFGWQQS
ncbi:MAG: HAD-IIIA family hydrolase [Deltaproteobacteria bacterium]|nr:HAD-IIIA family hydrolase [Deltaproteobacteria bacterium]MBV8452686.1 HAD-IIIA family hydrolase [Deltaproteobacteria bacterium]